MRRRAANIRATTHRDTPAAFPSLSSGHGFSAPHWGEWTEWTEPIFAGQNRRSASCYEPRGFGKRRSHYFDADADVDFGFGVDGAHQGVGRTLSMGEIHALTASEPPMHCNMARLTPAGNAAAAATAAVPPRQFLRQLGVGGAESPADCAVPHSDDGCGEHHVPEGPQHSGSLLMPAEAAVATFQVRDFGSAALAPTARVSAVLGRRIRDARHPLLAVRAVRALPAFLLPSLTGFANTSPACACLDHAQVAGAMTPPPLAMRPASAESRSTWGVEIHAGERSPPMRSAPAAASAAHGMLCRLACAAGPDAGGEDGRWRGRVGGAAQARRTRELARRGVPDGLRRRVWVECARAGRGIGTSGAAGTNETGETSGAAKAGEPSEAVKASEAREAIDLDVRRSSAELEAPLRHVLYGYVAGNPHVGYCQGMDRVARGLLQAGLPAAEALEAFRYLVDSVLPPGLFAAPLVRVQEDQRALEWLVARRLPRVHRHLARVAGGPVHLGAFTVAWMMTLLVDVLPQPAWLRVWDCLFVGDGGYGVVVRACLAVVEALQPQLVECAHAVDACVRLQGAREWMEGADPEAFFACLAWK
ncbi:hypothetical protein GGF37_001450 [Kickxella alabastrina]|nr:hypothetical protein GGF37_001450 [Kickxella alabastrina]